MADGKVVIITGGTYGIGRGITLKLAGLGWRVVACGLDARQPGSVAENGRAGTRWRSSTSLGTARSARSCAPSRR